LADRYSGKNLHEMAPLMSNELDRIKREIAELRTDYTSRLDALSDRLIKLEQDPAQVSNSVNFSENQDSLEGLDITLGLPEDAVSKKSPLHSPLHSTVQRDPWTGQRTAIANQEKRSAQKLNQGTDAAELESTTGDNSWIGERATKATQKQSPAKKIGQDVVVAGFFASVNNLLDEVYKTGGFEQGRNANYRQLRDDKADGCR